MNLKSILKRILKNKVVILSVVGVLSATVVIWLIVFNNQKTDEIFEKQSVEVIKIIEEKEDEEQVIDNQRIEQLKVEYSNKCDEYDQSVDAYNSAVNKINDFIDKVEKYDVIDKTTVLTPKVHINRDFELFESQGENFADLEEQIITINAEAENLQTEYYNVCQLAYGGVMDDYNILVSSYNELLQTTSVDFIEGITKKAQYKYSIPYDVKSDQFSENDLLKLLSEVSSDTENLAKDYVVASQITNPSGAWVLQRLKNVKSINGQKAVSKTNDPNGLLDKDGGYSSCIYFISSKINADEVKGEDAVAKGVDAGGAVEVYPTLEDALARCEYLSQFDDTILYSGSYTIIGTTVIRTSYKLNNQEQKDLTNEIVKAITAID